MNEEEAIVKIKNFIDFVQNEKNPNYQENEQLVQNYCRALITLMPSVYKSSFYQINSLSTENIEDYMEQKNLKYLSIIQTPTTPNGVAKTFAKVLHKNYDPKIHVLFRLPQKNDSLLGAVNIFAAYELNLN